MEIVFKLLFVTQNESTLINHNTNDFQVFDNYAVTVMIGGEPYTLGLFDTAGNDIQTNVFIPYAEIKLKEVIKSFLII